MNVLVIQYFSGQLLVIQFLVLVTQFLVIQCTKVNGHHLKEIMYRTGTN
jgi:hypothetical protein